MGGFSGKILGMKMSRNRRAFLSSGSGPGGLKSIIALAVFFLAVVTGIQAQPTTLGHATDFTSNEYFEPPNDQKVKMILSGASASPLPVGKLDITDLKIVTFDLSGKTNAVIRAPECVYSPYDGVGVASSAGHLELQTGDGKMRTTGDGFLWQQSDQSLTISNNVHTVVQMKGFQLNMP
jgi:hypothetical protein